MRWLLLCAGLLAVACKKPYRIGEYVLVEWEGHDYPAYIIDTKGPDRYRVHFEGYDTRWDQDVTLDRIKGRAEPNAPHPPAPAKVARAAGIPEKAADASAPVSPYKPGDRVRVRWRGSVYPATIVGVVANDKLLIHYDGHESAWDETVGLDRIVSKR